MESGSCAECGCSLAPGEGVALPDRRFCDTCYAGLRQEVKDILARQGEGLNYPLALVGALGGGVAGAVGWWAFTTATQVQFGLIGVAISWLVARGARLGAGHRRSMPLSIAVMVISAVSFLVGYYLVLSHYNSFLLPPSVDTLVAAARQFDIMDGIFLAIVVYEARRQSRPIRIG